MGGEPPRRFAVDEDEKPTRLTLGIAKLPYGHKTKKDVRLATYCFPFFLHNLCRCSSRGRTGLFADNSCRFKPYRRHFGPIASARTKIERSQYEPSDGWRQKSAAMSRTTIRVTLVSSQWQIVRCGSPKEHLRRTPTEQGWLPELLGFSSSIRKRRLVGFSLRRKHAVHRNTDG